MNIDRPLFLLLTAALAGVACAENPPPQPLSDFTEAPVETAPPHPVVKAPLPEQTNAARSTQAPAHDDNEFVPAGEGFHPAGEGFTPYGEGFHPSGEGFKPAHPSGEGGGASFVSPSSEGGGGGGSLAGCGHTAARFDPSRTACNDAQGTPGSCTTMAAPIGCGDDFTFPGEQCGDYKASLKPKIAERAIGCVLRLSGRQVCDACNTYRCGYEALMSACPDPSADADCTAITRACPSTSRGECRAYLSGLTPPGRKKMVTCMTAHDGCSVGLYSCSEGL